MLFNTSYFDKKVERQINETVGHRFSLKERWKLRGIGSQRLTIKDIAEDYKKYLNAAHYQTTANLELRPKGLIIHFKYKQNSFSWLMPYADLQVTNDRDLQLSSGGRTIFFKECLDQSFLTKLLILKGSH